MPGWRRRTRRGGLAAVDVSVRRSGQSTVTSAIILIVCSGLCFAIGLGVGFAVWGPESVPDEGAPMDAVATDPTPDATKAAAPADPDMQHLESLETVWPARHLFISIDGTSPDTEAKEMLASLRPGGVMLTQRNVQSTKQAGLFVDQIKSAVALGDGIYDLPLIAVDQEGGVVNRLNLGTAPGAREIADRRDLELARQVGKTYAEACAKLGVGVMLAPVLDIFVPGAAARMESRTFGSDEKTVTAMGMWFASGVIEGGVIPVVKHYPGLGGAKADARRALPILNQDTKQLAATMYPFILAADMKIPGIIAGHISVPVFDKSDPPRPSSLSPTMINTVLRDKLGYNGVVIADDIALDAVTASYSLPDAAVEALASGCDAIIVTETDPAVIRAICDRIEAAVQSGELAGAALQDSKKRLDNWQAWLRSPTALAGALPNVLPATGSAPAVTVETQPETNTGNESDVIYTVQAGDVLSRIAAKYEGVSSRDIAEWNNLSNANIRVGQDLKIRVPSEAPAPPEPEVIEVTPAPLPEPEPEPAVIEPEPAPLEPEPEPETTEPEPAPTEPEVPISVTEYVVQSGDVLSRIASKLNVTTQQIMEWNDLENTRLSVGQTLMIGGSKSDVPTPEIVEPEPEPDPVTPEPEPETPEPEEVETSKPAPGMTEYTVQSGDILSRIATKFDVTTKQIMEWNDLENTRISIGQKLMIGAPAANDPEPENVEPEPAPETPEPEEVVAPEPEVVDPEPTAPAGATEYTVQSGDALSRIASKFNVTTKQIMEWNGLDSSRIRVGQKLTLVPGEVADTTEPEVVPDPSPEPEPAAPAEVDVSQKKHSVQLGETLSGIAAAYGVSVSDVLSWNDLDSDAKLQAGRVLTIYSDPSEKTPEEPNDTFGEYVIQSGDSPLSIATKYEISPEDLMDINGITDVNTLRVGQTLRVPKP